MGRHSIENIGEPPVGFDPARRTEDPSGIIGFETVRDCQAEDRARIATSRTFFKRQLGGRNLRRSVQQFAGFLEAALTDPTLPLSAGSRTLMREWRRRTCGWLWSLVDGLGTEEWVYFTVVLPGWWVKSSKLKQVSAAKLKAKLRAALYRAGVGDASGWLYAMIHGEFDGDTNGVPLHFHGVATKGMIRVLRRMRDERQFHPNDTDQDRYPLVSIARKLEILPPWGNLPNGLTYTSKSIWLQQDSKVDEAGARHRVGRKHRINDPKHLLRCLTWLHEQPVKDQVLLVRLSVVGDKLIHNKRGARKATMQGKPVHQSRDK